MKYIVEIKAFTIKSFKYRSKTIQVGASIGVASYPEDANSPEELLKLADKVIYDNK